MGLVLDWQKKLGYTRDPFDPKVSPASHFLVGVEDLQERINLFIIKEERFGTICGEHGTGKSLLLQWINEELAPQRSHAQQLVDAKVTKHEEIITELLSSRLSFFERKFSGILKESPSAQQKALLQRLAKEQKNVLLIDNAGSLNKHDLAFFSEVITKTPTHVIFADIEEKLKKLDLHDTFTDKLKLEMPLYDKTQLETLLQHRIEGFGGTGTFPFDQDEVNTLIKKSDHNPAKLLQLARERAIELSIKVQETPQPQVEKKPTKAKFFSIQIERAPQAAPPLKIEKKESIETKAEDMAMLAKIVQNKPQERVEEKHHPEQESEEIVEELLEEFHDTVPTETIVKRKHTKKKR